MAALACFALAALKDFLMPLRNVRARRLPRRAAPVRELAVRVSPRRAEVVDFLVLRELALLEDALFFSSFAFSLTSFCALG